MKLWEGLLISRRIGPLLALCLLAACATGGGDGTSPRGMDLVSESQSLLAELGYAPGPVDGVVGARTAAAVRAYQADQGLVIDGGVGKGLLSQLRATRQAQLVMQAQKRLAALGYDPGPIDGKEGAGTRAAVAAFQFSAGLERDGRVTAELVEALAAAPAKAAPAGQPAGGVKPAVLRSASHILEPGDRILLRYLGTDGKAAKLAVEADGRLVLPGAGSVRAAGLRLKELRDTITVQLVESYVDKLKVGVELDDRQDLSESDTQGAGAGTLEPGDRARIRLADGQKPFELDVAADGSLTLPGAERVQAAGLKPDELEVEITLELLESYMSKLDVSVDLVAPDGTAKPEN